MTDKKTVMNDAEILARRVLTEIYKQPAPEKLVRSMAKKMSEALPLKTINRITAQRD